MARTRPTTQPDGNPAVHKPLRALSPFLLTLPGAIPPIYKEYSLSLTLLTKEPSVFDFLSSRIIALSHLRAFRVRLNVSPVYQVSILFILFLRRDLNLSLSQRRNPEDHSFLPRFLLGKKQPAALLWTWLGLFFSWYTDPACQVSWASSSVSKPISPPLWDWNARLILLR